jgi:hypothetical protein
MICATVCSWVVRVPSPKFVNDTCIVDTAG